MPSSFSLIKNHDSGSLTSTDELSFVYPFLVSKSVDAKLKQELRQFMMNQYLSQIKITNAIKVTTQLSNPRAKSNIPKVDTHEFDSHPNQSTVNLNVGGSDIHKSIFSVTEDISVDLTKQEYIDKFRVMIQHMVKTEPRFQDLDPIVTTLTLENLLTVPVIAASKVLDISNDVLYWVLFAAMGMKVQLTSSANLSKIESALRTIPKDSYSELLDPEFLKTIETLNAQREKDALEVKRVKVFRSLGVDRYLSMVKGPLDAALMQFKRVLDVDEWDKQTGIKTSIDSTLSASAVSTMGSSQQVLSNAKALFASLLSNHILHTIQSLSQAIISSDEVNISGMITDIANEIIDETDALFNKLLMGMLNAIQSQSVTGSDLLFGLLEKSCKANSRIDAAGIISKLDTASFSIRGDTNQLADYTSEITAVGVSSVPLTNMIAGFINDIVKYSEGQNLTGGDISSDKIIHDYTGKIVYIMESNFTKHGIIKVASNLPAVIGAQSNGSVGNLISDRFKQLTGSGDATKFFSNIAQSLSNVATFTSLYGLYSYFCEYTGELAAEVQVKKQGVMAFPNYCLVVPMEMLRPIYAVLSARNFKTLLDDPDKFDTSIQVAGRVSEFKIIGDVSTRLGLKNLIVIDGKTIYYKWMFSGNIQRISISSLSSYNKSQQEFLKAF